MSKPKTVTSIYLSPQDRVFLEEAALRAGMRLTTYIKRAALRQAARRAKRAA